MSREGIGQQLQAERKRQKLNQSDIADKLQCSRPSISNIENGRYQGSLQLLERYLNIMGFELTATPKQAKRPTLDELDSVYNDD